MKAVMGTLNDEQIIALSRHFSAQAALPPPGPVLADKVRSGGELGALLGALLGASRQVEGGVSPVGLWLQRKAA